MPRFAQNPETGEVIVYDDRTAQWRPAGEIEQNLAASPGTSAVLSGLEGATGIPGLISPELGEALNFVSPTAGAVGLAGTLGGGTALTSVGRGMGRMAQRVIARDAAQETAERGARDGMGFVRPPEEMLPEPAQGAGRILRAGVESTPVARTITDFLIKVPNQKNLNRLVMRGLGATDKQIKQAGGRVTDDLMAAADANVGRMFDKVGANITAKVDDQAVMQKALELNDQGWISNQKLVAMADEAEETGRNLMDMRSRLQAAQRAERDIQLKNRLQNHIDDIDEIIASAVDDDEVTKRLYSEARARYKLSLAVEKGQVWTNEGINPKSLDTALRSLYGRQYRRNAKYEGMPADVANALRGARMAQGVDVGVPTSGTAERLLAANVIGLGAFN